ncbi:MAG TPA: CHRD domain-containing protein [Brevundimonas sp.]|nr:CHRD domain-containing protein [Brevundimonas sp.]
MKSRPVATLAIAAAALAACLPFHAGSDQIRGRTLTIALSGAAEGPGLGDPDGSGTAELLIDPARGRFCYLLTVEGIAPAQLAHIHKSPAGQSGGPIVVHLEAPTDGDSERCMAIDPAIAQSLLRNGADYYVNVHNAEHPGGAVRGQLDQGSPSISPS